MGAQQTKDRVIPAGSTVRQTRKQPRNLKDTRIIGSNIFTEHSGENTHSTLHLACSTWLRWLLRTPRWLFRRGMTVLHLVQGLTCPSSRLACLT